MDLLKNPFHILGATTRDDKIKIMDLAEDCRLLSDAKECMEAQSTLTRPQNRIAAEIAWLPGVDPAHVDSLLKQLDSPHQTPPNIVDLPPLAGANFLIARSSCLTNIASTNLLEWILAITYASERIAPEEVRVTLNEDRKISGFPQIADLSVITDGIQKQRDYYIDTLSSAIHSLSVTERARILTLTLETVLGNSNNRCPILIDELIQAYEVEVGNVLEKKQKIITALDEKLRAMVDAKSPDSELEPIVNQLIEAVKDWDTIAQPIQLSKRSRGERHTDSFEIAGQVRNLAVDIFNDYGKYEISQKLLNLLPYVFAEVPEIVEPIEKDRKDLEARIHEEKSFEKFKVVETQAEKLKAAADVKKPDSILTPMVNQLIQIVKTWETSTHPIEANCAVAIVVRNNALHLWNEHQKLDFAIEITNTLIEVFKGVNGLDDVNNKLNEDVITLRSIELQRRLVMKQHTINEPRSGLDTGCIIQIIIFGILALIGALSQGC